MFVRTIYATGDPGRIDTAIDGLSTEGRRLLAERPGYRGFGLFVDRGLGKLLIGTWWDSEQARLDSNARLREWRAGVLERFAATVAIDNYEVADSYRTQRPGPGAALRLSRLEVAPSDADRLIDTFKSTTLPKFQTLQGMIGTTLRRADQRPRRGAHAVADLPSPARPAAGQASARHESAGQGACDRVRPRRVRCGHRRQETASEQGHRRAGEAGGPGDARAA